MEISALDSDESLAEFVSRFERGELPRALWTHGAHVAMATVYLRRYGKDVLREMREAIRRHNRSAGTPENAYHETLTVFWLAVLDVFIAGGKYVSELDAVRRSVAEFGGKRKLHEDFYSFDVVGSDDARHGWVQPDRQPLEVHFLTSY